MPYGNPYWTADQVADLVDAMDTHVRRWRYHRDAKWWLHHGNMHGLATRGIEPDLEYLAPIWEEGEIQGITYDETMAWVEGGVTGPELAWKLRDAGYKPEDFRPLGWVATLPEATIGDALSAGLLSVDDLPALLCRIAVTQFRREHNGHTPGAFATLVAEQDAVREWMGEAYLREHLALGAEQYAEAEATVAELRQRSERTARGHELALRRARVMPENHPFSQFRDQ